jgi:hypothetical protein
MIHFSWKNPDSEKVEGVLTISLDTLSLNYFKKEQLPLIVSHKNLAGETVWSSRLWPGCFSTFVCNAYTTCYVNDYSGKNLIFWKWDPFLHGDFAHQLFEIWSTNNTGANGIAIGTHHGISGEWVGPILKGNLKATLVEASKKQFEELVKFYEDKPWVICKMQLVTTDGSPQIFYEGGSGLTNSTKKEIISQFVESGNITENKMPSTSINDLITEANQQGKVKWIHLDVEGMDYDLVLSISPDLLPELLLFESLHLSEEKFIFLKEYLESKNFQVYESGWNTICLRK